MLNFKNVPVNGSFRTVRKKIFWQWRKKKELVLCDAFLLIEISECIMEKNEWNHRILGAIMELTSWFCKIVLVEASRQSFYQTGIFLLFQFFTDFFSYPEFHIMWMYCTFCDFFITFLIYFHIFRMLTIKSYDNFNV